MSKFSVNSANVTFVSYALLCWHNKLTIPWLFHQTNEFERIILYTNIMYLKASSECKQSLLFWRKMGDEAVDHEMDL